MTETNDLPGLHTLLSEGKAFAHSDNRGFRTPLNVAGHALVADEPVAVGGTDQGPSPYGFLSAALASCTAMTLHSYAKMKQLPVTDIRVLVQHNKVHETDCEHCEKDKAAKIDQLERTIWIDGDVDAAARERLLQIAERCPVHRTLHGAVRIVTRVG
jgi:uncharacterized OsmC-like protein